MGSNPILSAIKRKTLSNASRAVLPVAPPTQLVWHEPEQRRPSHSQTAGLCHRPPLKFSRGPFHLGDDPESARPTLELCDLEVLAHPGQPPGRRLLDDVRVSSVG